jgi:hypothetical protein
MKNQLAAEKLRRRCSSRMKCVCCDTRRSVTWMLITTLGCRARYFQPNLVNPKSKPPINFGKIPRLVTETAQAKSVADQIHRLIDSHCNQVGNSHKFRPWNPSNTTQAFMLQSAQSIIWEFFQFILTAISSGKSIDSLKHAAKKSLSRWLDFPN